MNAILPAILAILSELAPLVASSASATKIVAALMDLVPFIIKEEQALMPEVKAIIAQMSGSPHTPADDIAALEDLNAQVDAAFDAAAAAALAADQSP